MELPLIEIKFQTNLFFIRSLDEQISFDVANDRLLIGKGSRYIVIVVKFYGKAKKKICVFRVTLPYVSFLVKLSIFMSPTIVGGDGGGDIVFSVDPVGVGVATCLHSISLINGWILAKFTQIYHWVGEKCLLDFDDLDPVFKVTQGLRVLEKAGKLLVCTLSPAGTNGF